MTVINSDNYDVIFTNGEYQLNEIRKNIDKLNNKEIIPIGYFIWII